MPRISGFSAAHDSVNTGYRWEHDESNTTVDVVATDTGKWYVEVADRQIVPLCTEKTEARKLAMNVMRNSDLF